MGVVSSPQHRIELCITEKLYDNTINDPYFWLLAKTYIFLHCMGIYIILLTHYFPATCIVQNSPISLNSLS